MTLDPAVARPAWTRDDWLAFADRLLDAARTHASENHARITFPGDEGGYGRAIDGLEGFARTFLIAGFRITGAEGRGVDDLIDFYRRGLIAGVDPEAPDRWVRMDEHAQAKVEAASIAVILDMTREWLWETLDDTTQQRMIDYLAHAVGDDTYPRNNWLWFRLVVQTFLRSVGGPWSPDDMAADLALHDSFVRAGGWFSDGDERSYDHYVGWALHLYPVLWARMRGAADLGAAERATTDAAALDRYLQDAIHLVGADGSPLMQGRSLIYRFAAAAPFWAGVLAGVPSVSFGMLRQAAEDIVRHFDDRGAPDANGVLTMGWHHEWRDLAQSYSGPGSPYWAAKGLLGIMLPADHPVWSAPAQPVPAAERDSMRVIESPGWIVSSTAADGIVRVINHGTDHAFADVLVADSPLYAQLGYSTATAPLLDEDAWTTPLEQAVVLVDEHGRATHRAAMQTLACRIDADGTGIAASTSRVHWVEPEHGQRRHGSGLHGEVEIAGRLTVVSLVRGAWEVRVCRVDEIADSVDPAALTLQVGGWPISGPAIAQSVQPDAASASDARVASTICALTGGGDVGVVERADAGMLGPRSAVPTVTSAVAVGTTLVVATALTGDGVATVAPAADIDDAQNLHVTWPDGAATTASLEEFRLATGATR